MDSLILLILEECKEYILQEEKKCLGKIALVYFKGKEWCGDGWRNFRNSNRLYCQ